jgi:hypothetical protein
MGFRRRHGILEDAPDRDIENDAPPRLRAFLHEVLVEQVGPVEAYEMLCKQAGIVPDGSILSWGANDARPEVARLVEKLPWPDVFEMLEELGSETRSDLWAQRVNEVLARSGVAYEMNDEGEFWVWDPEGAELEVAGDEQTALEVLEGDFRPVRKQYLRALRSLHGRPADPEKAVADALGALEGVARISTGKKDFGRAIDSIFSTAPGWHKALAESLKKLYAYSSQLPGARHGRHQEAEPVIQEALYTVRACGAAIAYIAFLHRAGSS